METFYLIMFFLSLVLGLTLTFGFIFYLVRNKNNRRLLLRSLLGVTVLIALIVIPYKLMNTYGPHWWDAGNLGKNFFYDKQDENRYQITDISENDSLNYELHFSRVSQFKSRIERDRQHINRDISFYAESLQSQDIRNEYLAYQQSADSLVRDVGYLFYALHQANLEQEASYNQQFLDKVSDRDMPYFSYTQGLNSFNRMSRRYFDKAEGHFLTSIGKGECITKSYEQLSYLYWYFGEEEKLRSLINHEETVEFVPFAIKRNFYFIDFNLADYWGLFIKHELSSWNLLSVGAAGFLLALWIMFLRKFDIYEPEKRRYLLVTFILSVVSMQLLYPIHDFQWGILEYYRPTLPSADFMYITISTGMAEEFVKILPVLFMLKFSKAINEPFDYILYPAVAALGFSFLENIIYFHEGMYNVSIRGFYCCIGHMTFSATIGYGMMLAKYRGYNKYMLFGGFFLIAALFHGFYDFWLMDAWAIQYQWVSDLMILLFTYLLIFYTTNTLNISNFYDPAKEINIERVKFYGLIICVSILMTGYIGTGLAYGREYSNEYLWNNSIRLMFFMLFFVVSLGAMRPLRGYMATIGLPLKGLFKQPKKFIDLSGLELSLKTSISFSLDDELIEDIENLNQKVSLKQRLIVDDNLESYVATLSTPVKFGDHYFNQLVLIPVWDKMQLNHKKRVLNHVYLMNDDSIIQQPFIRSTDLPYLGKLFSFKINPQK